MNVLVAVVYISATSVHALDPTLDPKQKPLDPSTPPFHSSCTPGWRPAVFSFDDAEHAAALAPEPLDRLTHVRGEENTCQPGLQWRDNVIRDNAWLGKIPRLIHQTSRSRCLTQGVYKATASWSALDGFSYYFHDDDAMLELLKTKFPEFPRLGALVEHCMLSGTMKADVWRYLVLWVYGGVYADVDSAINFETRRGRCGSFNSSTLSPADEAFFVVAGEGLSQWFLAASPRHPFMYYALRLAMDQVWGARDIGRINAARKTGPEAVLNAHASFVRDGGGAIELIPRPGNLKHVQRTYRGTRNATITVGGVGGGRQIVCRDVIKGKHDAYATMKMTHFSRHISGPEKGNCASAIVRAGGAVDAYYAPLVRNLPGTLAGPAGPPPDDRAVTATELSRDQHKPNADMWPSAARAGPAQLHHEPSAIAATGAGRATRSGPQETRFPWTKMAEHAYLHQLARERKPERAKLLASDGDPLNRFNPNWPCFWGEEAVGRVETYGRGDGWKYVCGFRKIQAPCVVYSLGSNGHMDFEAAVLTALPFCEVHIFDKASYDPARWFPDPAVAARVHFHTVFIAAADDLTARPPRRSFKSITAELGHTHVDVLKIDIEGSEFDVFGPESSIPISVGQIQLEIHLDSGRQGLGVNRAYRPGRNAVRRRGGRTFDEVNAMVARLEKSGMRMFHKEDNAQWGHLARCPCQEWAFIQRDWEPSKKEYPSLD